MSIKGFMSLAHAILVSLAGCPKSGYDLAKAFDGSVGFFWKATHQQIYRELTKLEEQGWLAAQTIAQEGRPDKKLYSLTGEGMDRLKAWLHEPCDLAAVKEELLLKVFAGHLVEPQAIAREIDRHRHLHRDRLAVYRDIEGQYFSDPKSLSKENKFHYLTLLSGIGYETAWIAWCDEAIAQLNSDLV
jgi:DNA-binding PadR family transcriptional regulator